MINLGGISLYLGIKENIMPKKKPIKGKPKVNKELEGLEIKINEFGQIITNYDINDINKFLNRNVDDKKLRDRDDISDEGEFMKEMEGEEEDEDVLFHDVDEDEFENEKKKKKSDEEEDEEEA